MTPEPLSAALQSPPRRFRPYAKYKTSGIEGLGDIPAHWQVRRLKTIARVQLSNVDKKSVEGDIPVRLCNYVDVYYNEHITSAIEFMSATATPEQRMRFSLRHGDVLITKDSESWTDIAVPAVVAEDFDDVVCGYHLAHIRPLEEQDGRFLARAFSAVGPRDQFQIAANGITRFGLSSDAIKDGVFAVPPLSEQCAIAEYLDRETAKIDALVAENERAIALLQERRTALITRAVTKGLDPNVPTRHSGIEWLGQIPAHWEVKRMKQLASGSRYGIQMGPFGSMLKDLVFGDTGFRVYGQENTISGDFERGSRWVTEQRYQELRWYWLHEGDIVTTRKGSIGSARVAPKGISPGIIDSDTIRVRVDRGLISREFLALLLHDAWYVEQQIRMMQRGAVIGGLNTETIANLVVAVPPLVEQNQVITQLHQTGSDTDVLVKRIWQGTERLKEFRAALISAAVTGKIDLREEAA